MNLHARLKAETATLHNQVEARAPMKRLMSPDLTKEEYGFALSRFWSIYSDLEPSLLQSEELREALPDLDKRSKLESLAHDLKNLGYPELSLATHVQKITFAQALGTLYVLEGSTLGAQVITKSLRRHSFIDEDKLNFFDHYGLETMIYWRKFLNVLGQANPDLNDEITAAAKMTFIRFAEAFAEGPKLSVAADVL